MENTLSEFNRTKGRVVDEINSVANVAEDLLKTTAKKTSEGIDAVGAKIQDNYTAYTANLIAAEQALVDRTKQAASATNSYVQDNPWSAVGIASTIGLIVGFIIAKR